MNDNLIITERVQLEPISVKHNAFVLELLNTEEWLKFIGDRNVHSLEDAERYIQEIINNPDKDFWIVNYQHVPAGMVTLIKRNYLSNWDLGFAFLPSFSGSGLAAEASIALINYHFKTIEQKILHAVTLPSNTKSIKLLSRLGFYFEKEIDREFLHIYTLHSNIK